MPFFQQQQPGRGECFEWHSVDRPESVSGGHSGEEGFDEQGRDFQAGIVDGECQKAGIQFSLGEVGEQKRSQFLAQQQAQFRVCQAYLGQYMRQVIGAQRGDDAEVHAAVHRVLGVVGEFQNVRGFLDDAPRRLDDFAARGRGRHLLQRAVEHHHAESVFQLL